MENKNVGLNVGLNKTEKKVIELLIENPNIIVNEVDGKIVSSCVLCYCAEPDQRYPSICIY